MSNIQQGRKVLASRIVEGEGKAPHAQRRQAFEHATIDGPVGMLGDKVAGRAHEISDGDFDAARAAGLGEDQIFEIVVCAAVGEATRQYETAMAALEAASKE
jgi:hypothetical protein